VNTVREIESAIAQLEPREVQVVADWLREYRVGKTGNGAARHRFASASLIGCLKSGIKGNDNDTFRRALSRQLNEKNR
jgi:hypothetical protein